MTYNLGGYCWVDMSKSMQTSDLTPVTTAFNMFTEAEIYESVSSLKGIAISD